MKIRCYNERIAHSEIDMSFNGMGDVGMTFSYISHSIESHTYYIFNINYPIDN